ncbi:hypothetical protein [Winogradskyella sp.]|uniref:hypothetical protein n=1 Tax=Winogradskyella sp. TaxID=1883156 RepID=UPI003BAB8897
MKLSKNSKSLKANSLVESVIAIAIISICILVAFLVYINVIKQNKSVLSYNAKHQVEELYQQSMADQDFENEDYVYKDYRIEKQVTILEKEHIIRFDFKIKTGNKTHTIPKVAPLYLDEKN